MPYVLVPFLKGLVNYIANIEHFFLIPNVVWKFLKSIMDHVSVS